jgi:thiamine pyrophosphokinase
MLGVVITGGKGPEKRYVESWLEEAAQVVSADSGFDRAYEWGVQPDYVVGDMDSLANREVLTSYPQDRIVQMPHEKDYTDTEIGLQLLEEKGCHERVIMGGGGGRLDHLLGLLALFDRDPAPRAWITHREEVLLIDDYFERSGLHGQRLSFFPVGTRRCRMASCGLKWPLDPLEWVRGDVGISNEATDDRVSVTMREGALIMVRELNGSGK